MAWLALYNGRAIATGYQIGAASSADGLTWTRYASNPVLSATGGGWESDHVKDPCLVHDGSQYVMYYAGNDGATYAGIGRATADSHEGTWTRYGSNPVIAPGGAGEPDEGGVAFPTVLRESSTQWHMWYRGEDAGGAQTVCYASSADGLTWTKHGTVIGLGAGGTWNDEGVTPGAIVLDGGTYYLFVFGRQGTSLPRWQGGVWTFTNPFLTYTPDPGNPTLLARFNDANTSEVLTANTNAASDQVQIGTTAGFNAGEQVYLIDADSHSESHRIASIDSGTTLTLEDAATANFTVANGAVLRSSAYNSVALRSVLVGVGEWWGYGTDFQVLDGLSPGGTSLRESSFRWSASDLEGDWSYDYDHGHLFPLYPAVVGTWDSVSAENPSVMDTETGIPGGEETPHVPQEPARALLEIYVPDEDASRWGEALWGTGVWSSAGWVDVTPQGVSADIQWGVSRADAGILAQPEAGLWTVMTYDPDRKLDPANEESPYAPAIVYGLPIRLSHRGLPIRTGYVESVAYQHSTTSGELRATDNIAALASVTFPSDVEIASTLYARARDVIAACGLPITVGATPAAGDPDIAEWLEVGDFTAWHIIYHSALEALHIPYIDHRNVLRFRSWQSPLDRNAVVGSPELIELVAYTSADQLYSIVQAMDAATDTMIERRVTPLPRYGARTHKRTIRTLDADDWADVVLEDRALTGLRWRPGDVFPLDADSVEFHARREIGELIVIDYPEADPDVEVIARILGMRVRVVDLGGTVGPDWRFNYAASTAALEPLLADLVDETIYLVDEDTGEYLYPDGVIGLE